MTLLTCVHNNYLVGCVNTLTNMVKEFVLFPEFSNVTYYLPFYFLFLEIKVYLEIL